MPEHPRFAVCIKNSGYFGSLEVRKLYQVLDRWVGWRLFVPVFRVCRRRHGGL